MSVSYQCPNPDCGVTLKTPNRVPPGKQVKCPKCNKTFTPESAAADGAPPATAAAAGGTLKFADEDPAKKPAPPPPPQPTAHHDDDDEPEESIKRGYGVVQDTEAELAEAEKNKVKFGEVQDKFKKSARGPAMALLVTPSNLLVLEGLLTAGFGLFWFVASMWPLVFNDGAIGEEELEEAIVGMLLGTVAFGWGCMICFGASMMQDLASYTWALSGAILGVVPLLVGIYGIVMLQNPKVKAGFEESEGGPDDDEDEEDDDKKKDEDDDEEEEDSKAKAKKKKKSEDDDEDEDDDGKSSKGKKKAKVRGKSKARDDDEDDD